MRNAEGKRPF